MSCILSEEIERYMSAISIKTYCVLTYSYAENEPWWETNNMYLIRFINPKYTFSTCHCHWQNIGILKIRNQNISHHTLNSIQFCILFWLSFSYTNLLSIYRSTQVIQYHNLANTNYLLIWLTNSRLPLEIWWEQDTHWGSQVSTSIRLNLKRDQSCEVIDVSTRTERKIYKSYHITCLIYSAIIIGVMVLWFMFMCAQREMFLNCELVTK